jgi:hypothetical protein
MERVRRTRDAGQSCREAFASILACAAHGVGVERQHRRRKRRFVNDVVLPAVNTSRDPPTCIGQSLQARPLQ